LVVEEKKDTSYYRIPDFEFTGQTGSIVNSTFFHNRIWVCCFQHLNDTKISPSMAILMNRIESRTDRDTALRLVTFALDSESTNNLNKYAQTVHAGKRQLFVAGNTAKMNAFAIDGFYQPIDSSYKNGFVHFFLVDREGHIRGIYNGTHVKDVDQLIDNIGMLEAAYYVNQNKEQSKKDDDGM